MASSWLNWGSSEGEIILLGCCIYEDRDAHIIFYCCGYLNDCFIVVGTAFLLIISFRSAISVLDGIFFGGYVDVWWIYLFWTMRCLLGMSDLFSCIEMPPISCRVCFVGARFLFRATNLCASVVTSLWALSYIEWDTLWLSHGVIWSLWLFSAYCPDFWVRLWCLLPGGLLTCPVLILVLYHCPVKGFSTRGIDVMSVILLLSIWGSLSMEKLSHGSLWKRSNPRGLIHEPKLNYEHIYKGIHTDMWHVHLSLDQEVR